MSWVHQIGESYKDKVISAIIENKKAQFYWSELSSDISTKEADDVLLMMTKLWTTITGFSFASDWHELYKTDQAASYQYRSLSLFIKTSIKHVAIFT